MKIKSLDLSNTYVTKVQRIDSLGQGVCIIDGNSVFVPKVINDEVIQIKITEKKKGVYFGIKIKLLEPAKERILSECTHYSLCSGCNYLHLSYQDELTLKKSSLRQMLGYQPFQNYQFSIHAPKERFFYRNRIQLHYDLSSNPIIGFKQKITEDSSIFSLQKCLLPRREIQDFYQEFVKNWQSQLPAKASKKGHVEIYYQNEEIHLAWNQPYSHLGFSQVNEEGNQLLRNLLAQYFDSKLNNHPLLELFCGNGNLLTEFHDYLQVTGFDTHGSLPNPHRFIQTNLYQKQGVDKVLAECKDHHFKDLVLDPPRTGFIQLADIISNANFERLFYISCWPSTMVRDLNSVFRVRPWKKMEVYLVDMFPGTKHYETLVYIEW